MPLGTLDRTPPPFFKQGPSALSKLMVFSALALFLMVADVRFQLTGPLRAVVATLLYPAQWLVMQPVQATTEASRYLVSLHQAQQNEANALQRLNTQAAQALQVAQLQLENQQLRELLAMRERLSTASTGAQVLFDAADPFSRKVVIDRGQTHGIEPGSPVIDGRGVLGQVTQVYPLLSEVTLLVDREQTIPVLNTRTGARNLAYGQPSPTGDGMELRFTLANADIAVGDVLSTSGVDGVYPPGLPVARVVQVERRAESSFTRIRCEPLAHVQGALHVLVLKPVGDKLLPAGTELPDTVTNPHARSSKPAESASPRRSAP